MNIQRMQRLTLDLIRIDSVTGKEAQIGEFLKEVLQQHGMKVQTWRVSEDRKNILARFDVDPIDILFNTHIDTVPPQYGPHEDDDRIYGRGACDTHGILAAQLEALEILHSEGIEGLGILLVAGEEVCHDGALHAAACPEIVEPAVLIVGEPTENRLMKTQKGRLKGDLCAHGLEGHSGYPEECDSAVEKLCLALEVLWRAPWVHKDSREGNTVNVTILEGGATANQVPGFARARLIFRCVDACSSIKEKVSELLAELESSLPAPKGNHSHFEIAWDPAENDPITNLATLPGLRTGSAAYNTDIAYFNWNRCKTFLAGPGSILRAHKDLKDADWINGEWISKSGQIAGVHLYCDIVRACRPQQG